MRNVVQQFTQQKKLNKRSHLRLVAILLLLSALVATEVFLALRQTGIAMAGTAHCGIEEHSHTAACNENCDKIVHSHDVGCYSDETADVETKADWELSLSGVPYSDDFAADLIAVANTQLGYTESTANFTVDESGTRRGYSRYGAWYGNPYGEWSGMFTAFCLYYAGIPSDVIPMQAGPEILRQAWEDADRYRAAKSYTPLGGDLVFLDPDEDGKAKYTGIVSRVKSGTVNVIVGDMHDLVEMVSYPVDDGTLMGYVPTADLPEYIRSLGSERVERSVALPIALMALSPTQNSDSQIINYGGSNVATDGTKVSKTIAGTDIENIFDITLTVETQQRIEQVYKEPEMAVVIVMDISNTMRTTFGNTNRYNAAMEAAADFINHFAEVSGDGSQIGYVAFNTSAHKIFNLQSCTTASKADALIAEMKKGTGDIINDSGYPSSRSRFTNVEAGLKMGWDMIKNSACEHKYIIFLSDGFPTTYLKNHNGTDYVGYEPYSSSGTVGKDGVFYDSVKKKYLDAGTSYSDKAAIYAREMATNIKNAGGTIFSIGIDIGGQTIQQYIDQSHPVVDRTGTTYEIGSASNSSSYKTWLQNKIGSGYYYDSTDTAGLKKAYEDIFNEILHIREEESKADWITYDPLPIMDEPTFKTVEFIGFYDKDHAFIPLSAGDTLTGAHSVGAENTVTFITAADLIQWDLKTSGYSSSTSAGITTYLYKLVYRVRLRNEDPAFVEYTEYNTNDVTTLSYRIIETINGEVQISDSKSLEFPLPSVEGYLGEFSFTKVDPHGDIVVGAEFTLSHDTKNCKICHGDGIAVTTIPNYVAVSDADGTVAFTDIPSGHRYAMTETGIPSGYLDTGRKYWATVSYDTTTVNVAAATGAAIPWDETVLNLVPYDLPETGGGTHFWFTAIGLSLIAISALGLLLRRQRRRREGA